MNKRATYYLSLLRRKAVIGAVLAGAVLGLLAVGTVRYLTTHEHETHYHANFSVYINGVEQKFDGPQYYQEVLACDTHDSPITRTHMHDENPHLVHVHADLVTWGDFFANLGWSLNNSMLYDGKAAYVNGQEGKLRFMLNGQPVRSVAGEVIGDQDRLLIDFSTDDGIALQSRAKDIPSDAVEADNTNDPAGCKGAHEQDVWTRLRQAFWF
jgi:hypothetical protein